jgi:hypothetical protein
MAVQLGLFQIAQLHMASVEQNQLDNIAKSFLFTILGDNNVRQA